ncbi:MAG: hypothetical protein AAF458_23285 [Pseudomonadota bacterium]
MSASKSSRAVDKTRLEEVFGRKFSDEELVHFGSRLRRQLDGLETIRAWEPHLDLTEPATVTRLSPKRHKS